MLVSWMNQILSKKNVYLSNLHRDIRDGVILIQLIESVTGKTISGILSAKSEGIELWSLLTCCFRLSP